VQKFDAAGTFERTWGWGVQDGTSAFQVCTSGCQSGIAGAGEGQFFYLTGVPVDAIGYVYVTEYRSGFDGSERVSRSSSPAGSS
jgi:hypothetical protein